MFRSSLLAGSLILSGASTGEFTLAELVDRASSHDTRIESLAGINLAGASEYNLSRSKDGRILVFARSKADFRSAQIHWAELRDGSWTAPAPVGFSDPRWRDSDPWLTPDGRTLYFVSDRPTTARPDKTDLDIWRSRRTSAGWSQPEHLGDLVNGRGEELGPEVHEGRLYFAAAKRSGRGGLDIYTAASDGAAFGRPELMPEPLNSAESESDFTLSADGRSALFWRMVDGRGLLHASTRTDAGWSRPEPLPASVNFGGFNFTPAFSADGRRITYASAPSGDGLADVYEVDRP